MENATERPRFRNDLVAQPVEEEGVRYVDVTDPNSGSTFRFYDVEYSIACAMDGARDLGGLAEWTRAELGIETSPDELASVVSTLADLGYLEAAHEAAAPNGNGGAVAAAAAASDGAELELGPSGASAFGSPVPEAVDDAPSLELGQPGLGDAAPAEETPEEIEAPSLELGDPGAAAAVTLEADEASLEPTLEPELEAALEPALEIEAPPPEAPAAEAAAPAKPTGDELSFAGLMDDDAAATRPVAMPAIAAPPPEPTPTLRRQSTGPVGDEVGDDEPTQLPGAMVEDDDEDVSVDLSAHLSLDRDEVKEAVRASKVMMVPEIPKELLEEVESTPPPEPEPAAESLKAEEDLAELAQSAQAAMPLPPPPEVVKPPVTPAIPLPSSPPVARPIEPTRAPAATAKKKSSGSLVLLLVLLLAAGAVAVWKFVLSPSDDDKGYGKPAAGQGKGTQPTPPDPKKQPDPTPKKDPRTPAAPPSAKLVVEVSAGADVTAEAEGTIAWLAPAGPVKAGQEIAKLDGYKKWEGKVRSAQSELERHQKKLEKAKADNHAANIAHYTEQVPLDEQVLADAKKELAKLVLVAPFDGELEPVATRGSKVAAGDVVARVGGGAPALVATFDAGDAAASYKPESPCQIAAKGDPNKQSACVVESVDRGKVTVRVVSTPGSPSLAGGDEVVLLPAKK